jgi:hypothetical protein
MLVGVLVTFLVLILVLYLTCCCHLTAAPSKSRAGNLMIRLNHSNRGGSMRGGFVDQGGLFRTFRQRRGYRRTIR